MHLTEDQQRALARLAKEPQPFKYGTATVQREFKCGYNRAAKMVEALEAAGAISPCDVRGMRQLTPAGKKQNNPFADMEFDEALTRVARVKPGELADAITRDLVKDMDRARERIREAREDIDRGGRTRSKKGRFRL